MPDATSSKKMEGRANKRGANACAGYDQKPTGRCLQPGPVGRNPYLNFLREFRKKNCGLTPVETIKQGAKAWNSLPEEKKLQFIKEAFYAPKRRRISRSGASRTKVVRRSKSSGRVRKSKSRMPRKSSTSSVSRNTKRSRSRSRRRVDLTC